MDALKQKVGTNSEEREEREELEEQEVHEEQGGKGVQVALEALVAHRLTTRRWFSFVFNSNGGGFARRGGCGHLFPTSGLRPGRSAAMLSSVHPVSTAAVSSHPVRGSTASSQPPPARPRARPMLFHVHGPVAASSTPLRAVSSALSSHTQAQPSLSPYCRSAPARARVTAAAGAAGSPSGPAGLPFRKKSGGGNSSGRGANGPAPPHSASQPPSASALGYHPLEHVPAEEQDGRGRAGVGKDGRRGGAAQLSPAEVARTVAEMNVEAIVFAALAEGSAGFLAADARFVVDHNGDVFVEVEEDDDFLRILHEDARLCSALVGFGGMDEVALDDLIEGTADDAHLHDDADDDGSDDERGFRGSDVRGQAGDAWQSLNLLLGGAGSGGEGARGERDEEGEEDDDDDDDEDEGDDEDVVLSEDDRHFWRAMIGPDADHLFDTLSPEALGSLGAWGGRETLQWVHPVYFADKMISAVGADPMADMTRPVQRLLLVARVRPLSSEEEFRVRGLLGERASYDAQEDEDELDGEGEGEGGAGGVEASEASVLQGRESEVDGSRGSVVAAAARVGEDVPAADEAIAGAGQEERRDEMQEKQTEGVSEGHEAGGSSSKVRREGSMRVRKPEAPTARAEPRAAAVAGASESSSDAGGVGGSGFGVGGREEEMVLGVVGYRVEGLDHVFHGDACFHSRPGLSDAHGDAAFEVSWGADWRPGDGDDSDLGSSGRDAQGGWAQSDGQGAWDEMTEGQQGTGSRGEDGEASAQGASSSSSSSSTDEASAVGRTGDGILEVPPGATWLSGVRPEKDAQSAQGGGQGQQSQGSDLLRPAAGAGGGVAGEEQGEAAQGQGVGRVGSFNAAEWAEVVKAEQEESEEGSEGEEGSESEEGSEGEEGWEGSMRTVLYRLDLVHIQLLASSGCQEEVAPQQWQEAAPDLLAHVADSIVQRANSLERARRCMRDLCAREHGIDAEEVWLAGIDHLGIDVRVRMGLELQTLRFPFRYPASTEVAAERLLDELLRPRPLPSATSTRLKPRLSARQLRRLRARMRR
ncbi:unnamed protein product [Closterium sp. NIES-53]